ncbi:uncharacterized protein LOC131226828 [Magnolia sinica]|uniref:uncharacterized protein LOC131226828 n=1 Tax=Magnolia sinica TaxID=86752 RepID=UPI0026588DDE|nr:uncharacterized protein LOC131226828 [Magnolia sinica]
MRECVGSAFFSILINGSPKGFFKSSRGLRQGDPLFPFLFLAVGDALSRMLSKGQMERIISSFKIKGMESPISHIQFADNTLFFCEADLVNVSNLHTIVWCFEAVSGLKVNMKKSKMFGVNIGEEEVENFTEFFGCSKGSLPTMFVGLSLCVGKPPKVLWDKVIDCFETYLARWKCRYLSLGGRLSLIKAALSNLPVYFMSLFKCPSSILATLERLRREFLWHEKEEKKKFHLVNWKEVCQQTQEGGTGIRDLSLTNRALLLWNPCCRRNLHDWESEELISLLDRISNINLDKSCADSIVRKDASKAATMLHKIWKYKVPPKIAVFGCLVGKRKVLTVDNLRKRGMIITNICLCCMSHEETVDHLFIHCSFFHKVKKESGSYNGGKKKRILNLLRANGSREKERVILVKPISRRRKTWMDGLK